MDNYCHLTLSPVSKDPKSPGFIDYNEQLSRVLNDGFQWCWDDSRYNKAKVGEYFGFYFHGIRVVIHKIMDVKPTSSRLPSWSKNVGQGDRNVLELSHPLIEITWIEWQLMNAPESKMGTYTTNDLSVDRPRLYQYLKSILDTKTNPTPNIKVSIDEVHHEVHDTQIELIENEERNLILRLEKIKKIKKINNLQNEKSILLDQINNLTALINNFDEQIEELSKP